MANEVERIGSREFITSLAKSLDPLAFRRGRKDRTKRLITVYARISAALHEYGQQTHDEFARPYTGGDS